MPYYVRATKGKTILKRGIELPDQSAAERVAARFAVFGWKDIVVDYFAARLTSV